MTGPHLTPAKLVGQRFGRDTFGAAKIALVGFCPPPAALGRYQSERLRDQHFIHLTPDSVRLLRHGGREFLSMVHVYGGPVGAAVVEEMAYYGIDVILAYGLAGGLGPPRGPHLAMGDAYMVAEALVADGTTPHYLPDPVVAADPGLCALIQQHWPGPGPITPVRAATGDAIYREDDAMLDGFRLAGCAVVNLDSAHLFAAARRNAEGRHLCAVQCGIISDVVAAAGSSESRLGDMLAAGEPATQAAAEDAPMGRVGRIVSFYIESLAGRLEQRQRMPRGAGC